MGKTNRRPRNGKSARKHDSHNMGSSFPKPLTAEEEKYYILMYENGEPKEKKNAKNILVERNLRLVAHIVKKFNHPDVEDLISIGTIGLIKGISSFDSQKGTKLATYASRCIENAILAQWRFRMLKLKTARLLAKNGVYLPT